MHNQQGSALLVVMVLMFAGAYFALMSVSGATGNHAAVRNGLSAVKAQEASQAGLARAMSQLNAAVATCTPGATVSFPGYTETLGDAGYTVSLAPNTWTCPSTHVVQPFVITSSGCAGGCDPATPATWAFHARIARTALVTFDQDTTTTQEPLNITNVNAIVINKKDMDGFEFKNKSQVGMFPNGSSIVSGGNINYSVKNKSVISGTASSYDSTIAALSDAAAMFSHYFGPSGGGYSAAEFYDAVKQQATPFGQCADGCPGKVVLAASGGPTKSGQGAVLGSPVAPVVLIIGPNAEFHLNNSATCYCIIFNASTKNMELNNKAALYGALINVDATNAGIKVDNGFGLQFSQQVMENIQNIHVGVPRVALTLKPTVWQASTWHDF